MAEPVPEPDIVSKEGEAASMEKAPSPARNMAEDDAEYPSGLKLWLILCSIYLAAFLVALVRTQTELRPPTELLTLTTFAGPNHHRNGHPQNHRRIPLPRRHWLVRQCLPHHRLRLHASLRQALYLLLDEMGLPDSHRLFRDWLRRLWRGAKLHCSDCREGDCWAWHGGYLLGGDIDTGAHGAVGEKTGVPGTFWCCVRDRVGDWTVAWGCIHR